MEAFPSFLLFCNSSLKMVPETKQNVPDKSGTPPGCYNIFPTYREKKKKIIIIILKKYCQVYSLCPYAVVEENTAFLDIALNANRFFHIQQNTSCFFCRRLKSYSPATCMNSLKYSFQITNRHIMQQKHFSSFLTRLRWKWRKKRGKKEKSNQQCLCNSHPREQTVG